jgi:hypothetical protein
MLRNSFLSQFSSVPEVTLNFSSSLWSSNDLFQGFHLPLNFRFVNVTACLCIYTGRNCTEKGGNKEKRKKFHRCCASFRKVEIHALSRTHGPAFQILYTCGVEIRTRKFSTHATIQGELFEISRNSEKYRHSLFVSKPSQAARRPYLEFIHPSSSYIGLEKDDQSYSSLIRHCSSQALALRNRLDVWLHLPYN